MLIPSAGVGLVRMGTAALTADLVPTLPLQLQYLWHFSDIGLAAHAYANINTLEVFYGLGAGLTFGSY